MTTVRVDYARKIGQPDYSSISVSGGVEVTVPDGVEWQSVYNDEFAKLRQVVDHQVLAPSEGVQPAQVQPTPTPVSAAPPASATAELSQIASIVPKAAVVIRATVAGKVFHNNENAGEGKEHTKVRVTSPQVPQFTNFDMKCFDLSLIPIIKGLKEHDTVIVRGWFDGEFPSGSGKHALRATSIERVG